MDTRYEMNAYVDGHDQPTEYVSVYFTDIGTMTITFESNNWYNGIRPVIQCDFDVDKIRVIDKRGNDVEIGR